MGKTWDGRNVKLFFNISFHLKLQSNLKFAVHLCKRKVRNLNYVVKIGHDMKITKIICNESETPLNKKNLKKCTC